MRYVTKGRRVLANEIAGMQSVQKRLGISFDRTIGQLLDTLEAGKKIVVVGVGKSALIGRKFAATLTSTGAPAFVLDVVDALHGDLGAVGEGDLVFVLSYSGETEELSRTLPAIRRQRVQIVALTGNPTSTLGRAADIVIDTHVPSEACPLNLAPTTSTTAMLAVGDALAMVLLEARGFKKEDFARFHPGGTLGRTLLNKVGDFMRPLEDIVVLPESKNVSDALAAWNLKRAGAVIVTSKAGQLTGIYTHGDFVRGYQRDPEVGRRLLKSVMTKKPIHIRVDALAVEALNIFEAHRIDDLVVIDARRVPVGLIDAQDLAKEKLV